MSTPEIGVTRTTGAGAVTEAWHLATGAPPPPPTDSDTGHRSGGELYGWRLLVAIVAAVVFFALSMPWVTRFGFAVGDWYVAYAKWACGC